ncbi:MAG: hypothetical protein AAF489_08670 [Bacteroidota bacterium]
MIAITKKNLFIYFLLNTSYCFSQKRINDSNEEQYSFVKYIEDQGKSRGVTVEQTIDGGYILCGYTTDGDHGSEDILLIKTDRIGKIVWRKTYGGKGLDMGWAVRQCRDGGYIIAGYTDSYGQGMMDIYLVRTNSSGEVTWTKTIGGEKDEYGWDVRITKDQGFIIAGQTESDGNGEIDAYLVKVGASGQEVWSQTYGGVAVDRVFSVQQDTDGGYIAAGISYSYTSVGPEDRDGYVLKTDSLGKKLWSRTYGKDGYDVVHSISKTNDHGFILTGYGDSYSQNGKKDVYLIKINDKGVIEWLNSLGSAQNDRGIKGEQTKDGGYIAIGFTDENWDMYLVRSDVNGNEKWIRSFGEKNNVDFGYTVRQTSDHGYILLGHSEETNGTKSSVLLIKTDDLGRVNN